MTLQGSLDSFALADVLRLLASTKKSGRLRVQGGAGSGDLWLDSGSLVAAAAERNLGLPDALVELLRLEGGDFVFADDEAPPQPGEPVEVEGILGEADHLLEEWRGIEAVVPHLGCRVGLVSDIPADSVSIDRTQWGHLVAIGEGRSVADLGSRLGLGELKVGRVVRDLVEAGLVEVTEGDAPLSSGDVWGETPVEDSGATSFESPFESPLESPFESPVESPVGTSMEEDEATLGDPTDVDDVDEALRVELNGDAAAGSSDVALDATLGSQADGHSYLNGHAADARLPEALPGTETAEAEAAEMAEAAFEASPATAAAPGSNPFTHEPVPGA